MDRSSRVPFLALVLPLLLGAMPVSATPATVELSSLTQVYDGAGKSPTASTTPENLDVQWRFDPVETVFSSMPDTLPPSYQSLAFAAQATWGLGDLIAMAGTARTVESVDAMLVSWARAENYPVQAALNPAGWHHPITISIYSMGANQILTFKGEATYPVFVPWRPVNHPNNGIAFVAHVPFPPGTVLPEQAMILISYSTQASGFAPIGLPGPYNELNVATVGAPPTIGSDVNSAAVLWVRGNTSWSYPAPGTPAPLFRVNALTSSAGGNTPPVNAGTYQATATVSTPGYTGEANSLFQIGKAPASVSLGNLTQVADGLPKPATAVTSPPGLPLQILYNGLAPPPSALGNYPVVAQVTDPNYSGIAQGNLWLGHNVASWLQPWITNGSIPASATGDLSDPEFDGIGNLLEYAFSLDPSSTAGPQDQGLPRLTPTAEGIALIYRRNLTATDLEYTIETSTSPGEPQTWQPTSTQNSVIGTFGTVQVVQALLPLATDPNRFARVKISRLGGG